jgi:aspartate-semialdehyde dehydrogenase
MPKPAYSVAVIGATGLVGSEIVAVLAERRFPLSELRLYASLRSAGDEVQCGDLSTRVELLDAARLEGTDIVFLAAGEPVSAEWVTRAADAGAVAIDLSQLFAGDPDVPLIVPEVNAAELVGVVDRGLVASPNAPAVALAVALNPLHAIAPLRRLVVSTYEPVSSAGRAGIEELQQQTVELMNGRSVEQAVFPRRIAFNLIPHLGELLEGGASSEEQQTARALRRLLNEPELAVSVTRVRVPLFFGEALSVSIETDARLSASAAREALHGAPGVLLQDDPATQTYATPADAVGQDATCVGRIREDEAANALDLWITIDNVRKGSAVNAVQIAELLIRDHL